MLLVEAVFEAAEECDGLFDDGGAVKPFVSVDVAAGGALVAEGGVGDACGDAIADAEFIEGAVDVHRAAVGVVGVAGLDGFEPVDELGEDGASHGVEVGAHDVLGGEVEGDRVVGS